MLWTLAFWKGAAERSVKTFAATLAAAMAGTSFGLFEFDWAGALSLAAMATIGSLLIAIGNADFTAGTPKPVEPPLG